MSTFVTMQMVADAAALRLRSAEVMTALVTRDYDNVFMDKGDTIQIKVPNTFSAQDFTSTTSAQAITEGKRLLTLDTIKDVTVDITSKEKTLNINDLTEQVINPAMEALASKIDNDILALYKFVPYYVGASGTTPDALEDFANAGKVLNNNKAPMNALRNGVWGSDAVAKFQVLDALARQDASGTTETLRSGSIGKVFNIQNYLDQNVPTHTAGTYTALADVTVAITAASNGVITASNIPYSSMVLTSAAGTATTKLEKGDLIKITATGQTFTVLEQTAAAVSGVVTAKVYPAVAANITSTAATFPDVSARAHVSNLVFHPRAFVFANRPLSADIAGVESAVANFEGISVRVTRDYTMSTKTEQWSFDVLYGLLALQPELACRVLG